IGRIGVEIGTGPLDGQDSEKPGLGELMQRGINRRQRHGYPGKYRLLMQFLRRDMAIPLCKQQIGQRNTLPRRPQAGVTDALLDYTKHRCQPVILSGLQPLGAGFPTFFRSLSFRFIYSIAKGRSIASLCVDPALKSICSVFTRKESVLGKPAKSPPISGRGYQRELPCRSNSPVSTMTIC